MSRAGEVTLEFAGEDHTFRLAIGPWRKVQEACDAGPAELLARLSPAFAAAKQGVPFDQIVALGMLGRWRIEDVRQPILQGLIGGGMDAQQAARLVRDWVDERPFLENVAVAYQVVMASVVGTEDERPLGEPQAAGEASRSSPAASSGSGKTASTPRAARSAGRRARSTSSASGSSPRPSAAT